MEPFYRSRGCQALPHRSRVAGVALPALFVSDPHCGCSDRRAAGLRSGALLSFIGRQAWWGFAGGGEKAGSTPVAILAIGRRVSLIAAGATEQTRNRGRTPTERGVRLALRHLAQSSGGRYAGRKTAKGDAGGVDGMVAIGHLMDGAEILAAAIHRDARHRIGMRVEFISSAYQSI